MTECVLWTGPVHPDGYGSVSWGGGLQERAHRFVYEVARGQIHEGLVIHHTCENRRCVNIDHLVALSHAEHRAEHRRTACARGHDLTGDNLDPKWRKCRTCARDNAKKRWAENAEWRARRIAQSVRIRRDRLSRGVAC